MPIILAVEPDHKQAARLAAIVRHHVGAELVIGDTTERALDALGPRVPDMVLVPALLRFRPDVLLVSAGFDAYRAGPLASMRVTRAGFGSGPRRLHTVLMPSSRRVGMAWRIAG